MENTDRTSSSQEYLCHSVERCHWFTSQPGDPGWVDVVCQRWYRDAICKLPSWTLGSGNLMCDSCVKPVVSSTPLVDFLMQLEDYTPTVGFPPEQG